MVMHLNEYWFNKHVFLIQCTVGEFDGNVSIFSLYKQGPVVSSSLKLKLLFNTPSCLRILTYLSQNNNHEFMYSFAKQIKKNH